MAGFQWEIMKGFFVHKHQSHNEPPVTFTGDIHDNRRVKELMKLRQNLTPPVVHAS
jgi:hypothetical protein